MASMNTSYLLIFLLYAMLCIARIVPWQAVARCPSVRPSIRPCVRRTSVLLQICSPSDSHTIVVFFDTKRYGSIPMGRARRMHRWYEKSLYLGNNTKIGPLLSWNANIGKLSKLSKDTIFNNLEQPLTQISRSGPYLTLNISETVRDTGIVTMEYYQGLTRALLNGVILNDHE